MYLLVLCHEICLYTLGHSQLMNLLSRAFPNMRPSAWFTGKLGRQSSTLLLLNPTDDCLTIFSIRRLDHGFILELVHGATTMWVAGIKLYAPWVINPTLQLIFICSATPAILQSCNFSHHPFTSSIYKALTSWTSSTCITKFCCILMMRKMVP